MIVKMRFLNISGPRDDIDRVCEKYLSKYEMQIENAVTELKTRTEIRLQRQSSSHSFCRRTGKFGQICQDQRMICWR